MTLLTTTTAATLGPTSLKLGSASISHQGSPMGQNGGPGGTPRPNHNPLPHIDDLTARPKDIDHRRSIKRFIEDAETSLLTAETARNFQRPDIAFKDYLRAYIITVDAVQNSPEYAVFQSNKTDLSRRHQQLLDKIGALHPAYESIKQLIKADNIRTGVRPTVERPPSTTPNRNITSEPPHQIGFPQNDVLNDSPGKTKPLIHPKPQSLHGNAVQHAHSRSPSLTNGTQDIVSRLAALGGPRSSPGQDPRIKTHPISHHKPAGPREMPLGAKLQIGIDSSVPSLPRMPDAIYSPAARGSMTEASVRLPSSTSRGHFSRTGSASSATSNQASGKDHSQPAFSQHITSEPASLSKQSKELERATPSAKVSLDIAPGDKITPPELLQLMKGNGSILIIDIRVREDFDEGHIFYTSTICIEPNILMRGNPSCDDISESLVLSPHNEQAVFDKRNEYDLVVIYDWDSECFSKHALNSDDVALETMRQALVDLNYGRELKQCPRLLQGGVKAWKDLLGPLALRSTSKPSPGINRTTRLLQPTQRTLGRRSVSSKYVVKPLKEEDAKAWQETVTKDDKIFYQSTEEFIARYPPVTLEKESMTYPVLTKARLANPSMPNRANMFGDLPPPPSRPVPAIQRSSHSGLSSRPNDKDHHEDPRGHPVQPAGRNQKLLDQSGAGSFRFYTGLNNPGNWCYANSVLQSLLASMVGRELADPPTWKNLYKVPRKDNEKINHPQLMMQILSNLFHWMATGQLEVVKADTLMRYSLHMRKQEGQMESLFGDDRQHDAQEFMSFVLSHLDDETNRHRNRSGSAPEPDTRRQSLLQAAVEYWNNHTFYSDSIVDIYWRTIELRETRCLACNTETFKWNTTDIISCSVGDNDMSLEKVLDSHVSATKINDFRCNTCDFERPASTSVCYPRMPVTLCIALNRFSYNQRSNQLIKSTAKITWDLDDIDMTPYFPTRGGPAGTSSDKAFSGPFRYECFAVIEHQGANLNSGHYTAYVRRPRSNLKSSWLYCNDYQVTKRRMDQDEVNQAVFKEGNRVPYLAFFRRKDSS